MTSKIYVAGAGGMLGEAIHKIFKDSYILKCSDIDKNETWIDYLDFREFDLYKKDVEIFNPDYLFHIGAYTDLEYCELHEDDTYMTNSISVENAVNLSNSLNIPLIYISTAGIFDGSKDHYDDWDTPNPICTYARSKHIGEVHVQNYSKTHLILRAGWMMGGGPKKDKKFIQKIMQQIKDGATDLFIVNDKMGTPTYTHDFANNMKILIENEEWGTYNLVCDGLTDRLSVAKHLIKLLNLESKVKVNVVNSDYWKKQYFAPRPKCERLINKKLNLKGMNKMRGWQECLDEYIKNYYSDYLPRP